ncbi:hypothetical protein [Streptomyces sp. NPDC027717]|uniref:hypothetical protein n=1 Tax=Streptomyces sp. NPDC027717 TaxID=3155765 RepID=UPI0033DFFADB
MPLSLYVVVVEGCPTKPYMGTSTRSAITGYDSLFFTRRTVDQIVADLNEDTSGLTASWDGDSLILTASDQYNGDAFTEIVTPNEYGHYMIGGLWPWDVWSEDLDSDEQHRAFVRGARTPQEPADPTYSGTVRTAWQQGRHEAEQLLNPALRGQYRPHRHLVTHGPKPLDAPSTTSHSSPARRQR